MLLSLSSAQLFMLRVGLVVGGGGFIFGYDIGVVTGALPLLDDRFNLSSVQKGLVVSFLPLGSIFGCLFGGYMCDHIGRWKTIQIQNAVFVAGALIIAGSTSVDGLYVGRFIVGIASALSAIADIPYLTEVSAPIYRGRLTSAYEMLVVVGILFSFIMNLVLVDIDGGWRWMFGLPAIFAGTQSLLMLSLPESPKWLLENGHVEQARLVLHRSIEEESMIDVIISEFQQQIESGLIELHNTEETSTHQSDEHSSIMCKEDSSGAAHRHVMSKAHKTFLEYKSAFVCILVLMIFQQFTGGVVVRNYATEIFEDAGFSEHNALVFTIVLGAVKVAITAWTIYEVDSIGRKPLMLWGIILIGLGQFLLCVGFTAGLDESLPLFVVAASVITAGYSLFAPVCWILQSEMFPTVVRGRALAVSVLVSNIAQFVVNFSFLPLVDVVGDAGTFLFYFLMSVAGAAYIVLFTVETKEQEPAAILSALHNRSLRSLTS